MYMPYLKGPAHSKNENLYYLALAQTKRMQPILVSCEEPFRSNLQKKKPLELINIKFLLFPGTLRWTSS